VLGGFLFFQASMGVGGGGGGGELGGEEWGFVVCVV